MTRLVDVARVVRSKNAGPTLLTIDLMFADQAAFARVLASPELAPEAIARRYGVAPQKLRLIAYLPALAIKIVLERPVIAGDPGDGDVYGAQQHAPLLEIEL
jgi:hypothetical protein